MVKVKLDAQHYDWLSDDIREQIYWIVETGRCDDQLLDCAYDLAFIKSLCEDGVECKNDDELLELGKRLEKMVRDYDKTSYIRPRTVPGKNKNEAIVFIYE